MDYGYYLYNGNTTSLPKQLSQKEQTKLLRLTSEGDKNAKDVLFKDNIKLVAKVIALYYPNANYYQKEEFFQVGCLGLWNAINTFDINLGYQFSTYAFSLIHSSIKHFRTKQAPVKLSNDIKKLISVIEKTMYTHYIKSNGKILSYLELSKILKIPEEQIFLAFQYMLPFDSLSSTIDNSANDDALTLEDTIVAPDSSPEDKIIQKETTNRIIETVQKLTDREQIIICYSFGINCEMKSQQEIANILQMSQCTVSRYKTEALKKLKTFLPEDIQHMYKNNQKEVGSLNVTNHKKNKRYITDIYSAFYEYTKQEIDYILTLLPESEKQLILSYHPYQVIGKPKVNSREIAMKCNLSTQAINQKKWKLTEKINKLLILQRVKNILKQDDIQNTEQNNPKMMHIDPENYKSQIQYLISLLPDEKTKAPLLLRLGFIKNKIYSEEQIGKILNLRKSIVHSLIQKGIIEMTYLTNMPPHEIKQAVNNLILTKN